MAHLATIKPRPHTFRIDNVVVDNHAAEIGAIGLAVYCVISRYADRTTGEAYPKIGTICKKLRLGRTTVKKYLHILATHGLISISARWDEEGDPTSNLYTLRDLSADHPALQTKPKPKTTADHIPEGRSCNDPPPPPRADPEQDVEIKERETMEKTLVISTRQKACSHPLEEIVRLADDVTVCNHCYGLLDGQGRVLDTLPDDTAIRAA